MIWTDLMETWPGGYIHPLHERPVSYRPVWHAVEGAMKQEFKLSHDDE